VARTCRVRKIADMPRPLRGGRRPGRIPAGGRPRIEPPQPHPYGPAWFSGFCRGFRGACATPVWEIVQNRRRSTWVLHFL